MSQKGNQQSAMLILATESERTFTQAMCDAAVNNKVQEMTVLFTQEDISTLIKSHLSTITEAKYDSICLNTNQSDIATIDFGKLCEILKAGGDLTLHFSHNTITMDTINMSLMLGGFVDISQMISGDYYGKKPNWDIGTTAAVKINKSKKTGKSNNGWKISADDDDMDLVNENDLLDADVVEKKVESGDCSTKRRACKGCSCGRAEMEADMESKGIKIDDLDDTTEMPTSACGNCYRGDAFRCASCPFLGKPAFEKGNEKVILSLSDDI